MRKFQTNETSEGIRLTRLAEVSVSNDDFHGRSSIFNQPIVDQATEQAAEELKQLSIESIELDKNKWTTLSSWGRLSTKDLSPTLEPKIALEKFNLNSSDSLRYMGVTPNGLSEAFEEHITQAAEIMLEYLKDLEYQLNPEAPDSTLFYTNPALPAQNKVLAFGCIIADTSEIETLGERGGMVPGLSEDSLAIVGVLRGLPFQVNLDVSSLDSFTFFPGRLVALEGFNPTGDKFRVTRVFDLPPLPREVTEERLEDTPITQFRSRIWLAKAPFTDDHDLKFSPLKKLIRAAQSQPDLTLLILIGPFISDDHPIIQSGMYPGPNTLFRKRISEPLIELMKELPHLKVALVPSTKDIVCTHVSYPQPTFNSGINNAELGLIHPNFIMLENPTLLNINRYQVLIQNVDTLLALSKAEISKGSKIPRLERLCRHLLIQRSTFPVYPERDSDMDIDRIGLGNVSLTSHPDIWIVPSRLKEFSKWIEYEEDSNLKQELKHGTLFINSCSLNRYPNSISLTELEIQFNDELSNPSKEFIQLNMFKI